MIDVRFEKENFLQLKFYKLILLFDFVEKQPGGVR